MFNSLTHVTVIFSVCELRVARQRKTDRDPWRWYLRWKLNLLFYEYRNKLLVCRNGVVVVTEILATLCEVGTKSQLWCVLNGEVHLIESLLTRYYVHLSVSIYWVPVHNTVLKCLLNVLYRKIFHHKTWTSVRELILCLERMNFKHLFYHKKLCKNIACIAWCFITIVLFPVLWEFLYTLVNM